jgi:polyketide cyclase/dehydrase/lipid transport protein
MSREAGGTVAFDVPREVAYDYLVDPRNRPQWQSSLRGVSHVDGEPRIGQTWVDETRPGIKPRMRTTELDRPVRWSETGTWRFVSAELTLDFAETATGCDVTFDFHIRALGPLGALATRMSVPAVRADLRSAASRLAAPPT